MAAQRADIADACMMLTTLDCESSDSRRLSGVLRILFSHPQHGKREAGGVEIGQDAERDLLDLPPGL